MEPRSQPGAAIVTGASRGLGLGIARGLAEAGHPVVLAARDPDELERAARPIEQLGSGVLSVPADVTRELAADHVVNLARNRFGSVDVLVNNAGALPVLEPLDKLDWDRWRHAIDVDVRAAFTMTRAAAPLLRAASGTIINLAGAAGGTVASPRHAAYSPAQAALVSLSRCIGSWLAPTSVVVHCLCPSITTAGGVGIAAATAFGAGEGVSPHDWIVKRLGDEPITASDVGDAVVALLDERDGGVWSVDAAGLTAWNPFTTIAAR